MVDAGLKGAARWDGELGSPKLRTSAMIWIRCWLGDIESDGLTLTRCMGACGRVVGEICEDRTVLRLSICSPVKTYAYLDPQSFARLWMESVADLT